MRPVIHHRRAHDDVAARRRDSRATSRGTWAIRSSICGSSRGTASSSAASVGGHYSNLRHFFDANIFHPAPLTLAYSEHLVPQALQIFPIYALTGNPILCYNLLFLSTFVLSGLGMFLFARELTGSIAAAFIAGLLFAFAPYRVPQSSHLQVLSSQWMPFALYGFRRCSTADVSARSPAPPPLSSCQGLSCGYYLLYFSPFAAPTSCTGNCGAWIGWRIAGRWLTVGTRSAASR